MSRGNKLMQVNNIQPSSLTLQLLHARLKITLEDGRTLIGQLVAFDKHLNFVLAETEEIRPNQKRALGLLILRGDAIVSMSVEAPAPVKITEHQLLTGQGSARPAGRGMPTPMPVGLTGPVRGLGVPPPMPQGFRGMPAGFRPPPPPGFRQ